MLASTRLCNISTRTFLARYSSNEIVRNHKNAAVIECKYFADQMILVYGNQDEDESATHDLDRVVQ